jgi:hypothetical protein
MGFQLPATKAFTLVLSLAARETSHAALVAPKPEMQLHPATLPLNLVDLAFAESLHPPP